MSVYDENKWAVGSFEWDSFVKAIKESTISCSVILRRRLGVNVTNLFGLWRASQTSHSLDLSKSTEENSIEIGSEESRLNPVIKWYAWGAFFGYSYSSKVVIQLT